jgi:site-specific recombinase
MSPSLLSLARALQEIPPGPERTRRLEVMLSTLREDASSQAHLRAALNHPSMIRLLAEMGLPDHTSLLPELVQRAGDLLLPRLSEPGDLYRWLDDLGPDPEDATWIRELPEAVIVETGLYLRPDPRWIREALRLLAHRAAGTGLSRGLLRLGEEETSPFLSLPAAIETFLATPAETTLPALLKQIEGCRTFLEKAHRRLEIDGVDSHLVFQLDLLEAQLLRLERLARMLTGQGDGRLLMADLVEGSAEQSSVRGLLRRSLRRLARKVVEHAGESGEHYLVRTPAEWKALAWAAAGGGVLTVGTALVKYGIAALPLAPMITGFGLAANYFISFAIMQFLGFALASKQPALTAAALAGALEQEDGTEAEVDMVAALTRAQTIAMLGNVLVAIPVALGVAWLWQILTGHPPLSEATAHHGLVAMHPYRSLTILYAAITGGFLWMSSLVAGWTANWSALRHLPEAVEGSPRLRAALGDRGARWTGQILKHHLPGLGGYAALGLLLGFVPELASRFAGIGLEVRHVTLQSAAWALDYASLLVHGQAPLADTLWALLSIPLIGAANVMVSFALALRMATRARNLDARGRWALRHAILHAFLSRPSRFLWSP